MTVTHKPSLAPTPCRHPPPPLAQQKIERGGEGGGTGDKDEGEDRGEGEEPGGGEGEDEGE